MAKRSLGVRIREMWNYNKVPRGKVPQGSTGIVGYYKDLFSGTKDKTIDYTKNDYELFKAIYFASRINKKGQEYLLAAPFAKKIVNAYTSFTVGAGFKYELDNDKAQQELNNWISDNEDKIRDLYKFGTRDGDSYLYVDEMGVPELLDPETVDVKTDLVTGSVIGYDVTEKVIEQQPNGSTETYIYLKQYRQDSTRILRYKASQKQDKATVVYEKIYYSDDEDPTSELLNRPLPIVHFANEKEPRSVYGNSELQNLLILFLNYHAVLEGGVANVLYNGSPILAIKGVSDKKVLVDASKDDDDWDEFADKEDVKKLSIGPDTVLYLKGDGDAKYVTTSGVMADTKSLLEILFYLIVEGSEVPEFLMGTAVSSSKASTESQMPGFIKRIEEKQLKFTKVLIDLAAVIVDRKQWLSDTAFLNLDSEDVPNVVWNPIVDEDMQMNLNIVKALREYGLLSDETTLEQLFGKKVRDVKKELRKAYKDTEASVDRNNVLPEEPTRLQDELDNPNPDEELEDEE